MSEGRPVLVGTHTIGVAQRCYDMLAQQLADRAEVRLFAGQSDAREAEFFDQAGVVGAVTVATQIAGRGVDIRLSEQARENGGLMLIGLGHSRLARHHRQFLGRAGRQGDPFSAQFVSSLEDPFFNDLSGTSRVKSVMELLKIPPDAPITVGPVINGQFRRSRTITGGRSCRASAPNWCWISCTNRLATKSRILPAPASERGGFRS